MNAVGAVSDNDGTASPGDPMNPRRKRQRHCIEKKPAREAVLTVWTETDIFKLVGLSYVPPFMRFFHDVSA